MPAVRIFRDSRPSYYHLTRTYYIGSNAFIESCTHNTTNRREWRRLHICIIGNSNSSRHLLSWGENKRKHLTICDRRTQCPVDDWGIVGIWAAAAAAAAGKNQHPFRRIQVFVRSGLLSIFHHLLKHSAFLYIALAYSRPFLSDLYIISPLYIAPRLNI